MKLILEGLQIDWFNYLKNEQNMCSSIPVIIEGEQVHINITDFTLECIYNVDIPNYPHPEYIWVTKSKIDKSQPLNFSTNLSKVSYSHVDGGIKVKVEDIYNQIFNQDIIPKPKEISIENENDIVWFILKIKEYNVNDYFKFGKSYINVSISTIKEKYQNDTILPHVYIEEKKIFKSLPLNHEKNISSVYLNPTIGTKQILKKNIYSKLIEYEKNKI